MTNLWVNVEDLGEFSESDYAYDAVKTASFLLWGLSGRKFTGTTTATERYVSSVDDYLINGASYLTYVPQMIDGEIYNTPAGRYSDGTLTSDGSSALTRVRLRGRKVVKVHAVRSVSGVIMDPLSYYLSDHSTLSATPGASWPGGAIEVTYTYGAPPPIAGKNAARLLAIELVKMFEGDDTCALPQRVTSVTRQGVSYTILDDQTFIDELKTGIYAIDLFLKTVNPDKARAKAKVFSVDLPRARRVTGHPPKIAVSASDLYVSGAGGSLLLHLDEIDAEFLLSDPAWVLSGTLSTWTESHATAVTVAPVLDDDAETITVAVTYYETVTAIGTIHPGLLDLYATRPSIGDPEVDEIVPILTSNVIIQMGHSLTPVYTP